MDPGEHQINSSTYVRKISNIRNFSDQIKKDDIITSPSGY